eukprot:augustus_masked-scaffold_9-processed-gene-13.19-mRNA-1 protein AED:1.00 eAED:1.00 QI:0/-1/0/0/-1/1/1/0/117
MNNYLDAFAKRQSICQLNNLLPIEAHKTPKMSPCRAAPRNMSKQEKKAIHKKISDLLSMGMIDLVNDPLCSYAAFMVPTKGNKFRMVIDLRLLNDRFYVSGAGMPELEAQLSWFLQK